MDGAGDADTVTAEQLLDKGCVPLIRGGVVQCFGLKSLHAAGVLVANYVAERSAVRFSDKRVCLSERDSLLLKKIYRKD